MLSCSSRFLMKSLHCQRRKFFDFTRRSVVQVSSGFAIAAAAPAGPRPTSKPAQRVFCAALAPYLGSRAARELRRFFAAPQYALVIFFCVSPPLQLTISCVGIFCAMFADTTSDRSALRT